MNEFLNILVERFNVCEPIFTEEIKELFPDYSEVAVFNWIKAALEDETLRKAQRGVYYLPEKTNLLGLGESMLSPEKILIKKYLQNRNEVYGFRSGLNLENEIHISPQVPATLEITTNKASARVRNIDAFGGYREITLRKPRIKVTKENVDAQRLLDTITRVPIQALNSFEQEAMVSFVKTIDKGRVVECLPYFPAKTSKNLMESGYYDVLA